MDGATRQWLAAQPLGQPIAIGDEYVYLRVGDGGAELGAYLLRDYAQAQLEDALRHGFYNAAWFDAGVGCSADGRTLVLHQWLPRVSGWQQADEALDNLLKQLNMWRAELMPTTAAAKDKAAVRTEQRLRDQFTKAKP
jgi:hypothetical protein